MSRDFLDGDARRSDLVDIACWVRRETEKAYLVDHGGVTVWVPKSQCEVERLGHGKGEILTLPEWLAKEKGML